MQGGLTASQKRLSNAVVDAGVASQLVTCFEKWFLEKEVKSRLK